MISINDLKGFDFSKKYLKISENFSIKINGKQVDFKIEPKDRHYNPDVTGYFIKYEYMGNNRLIKQGCDFRNPFEIFKEVERDIMKSDEELNQKTMLIKNCLKEFSPDFDRWDELSKKLTSNVNILELYPNYKSSKIPQNLSKKDLAKYFYQMSKYDLEDFFKDLSMIDFEIYYQNLYGEDYEYFIRKAFTSYFMGEEYFNFDIYRLINIKRRYFHIESVLKDYDFDCDKYSFIVAKVYLMIHPNFSKSRQESEFERLMQIKYNNERDMRRQNNTNKIIKRNMQTNFNNLDDSLTKSKYVYVLKAISSNSKSQIPLRYKIPNENRDKDSVQTIALNNGHIKYANSRDLLSMYTGGELESVLRRYELKVSGKKNDLIERIKENLSDNQINKEFTKKYFILTEKGQNYLDKYYYLAEFYSVIPPNFTLEEFE